MAKRRERNLEDRSWTEEEIDPADDRRPEPYTPHRPFGCHTLRECGPASVALPLGTIDYDEIVTRQNLEQVGSILRRLDLQMADILELGTETRAILAGLAA